MSSILYRLGRFTTKHARIVMVGWLILLVALGGMVAAFADGTSDNFSIPGTESQEALDALEVRFPELSGTSAQIIVLAEDGSDVTSERAAITELVSALRNVDQISNVSDPFDANASAVSTDDKAALVTAQFDVQAGELTPQTMTQFENAINELRDTGAEVEIGGGVYGIDTPGVTIVEGLGLLVAFIVLFITFGSLLAAGLPLISALIGAGVSITLVMSATIFTSVSSTALLVALMVALAVGIDYALFIVSRHREYLAEGIEPSEAASRSLATAGSAVVFAGLTVMIALLSLAVANIPFLTVMGVAGAMAVLVAVVSALTLLPALLKFAGPRIQPKPKRIARRAQRALASSDGSAKLTLGARWIRAITSHPIIAIAVVGIALVSLAIPATDLRLTLPDNGAAGPETTQRKAYDLTSEHFGPGFNAPILVTADIINSTDPVGTVNHIAKRISALDEVHAISLATPNPKADTGVIIAIGKGGPEDVSTEILIEEIRELAPQLEEEYGTKIAVTGQTALQVDISARLGQALFPFGLLVVGLSIILLTLVFRSLLVPIIATLGYVLSVLASFGAVSAIFQWGWGASLLNVSRVGPVISFLPILLMGVLFGLAMDYQVFLVSRVREDYVHTGEAKGAVIRGFERSYRVIIAAAIIMISVFAAFVPEGDSMLKPIAFSLAVGVLIDAFLVRLTLVPATLALFGHASWRLPRWLDQRLPPVDVEGEGIQRIVAAREQRTSQMDQAILWVDKLQIAGIQGTYCATTPWGVAPGSLTVVNAPVGAQRTALLLALAGRIDIESGTLWVGDAVMPVEATRIHSMVGIVEPSKDLPLHTIGDVLGQALPRAVSQTFNRTGDLDEMLLVAKRALDAGTAAVQRSGLTVEQSRAGQLSHETLLASLTPVETTVIDTVCATVGNRPILIVDALDHLETQTQRISLLAAIQALSGTLWQDRKLVNGVQHAGVSIIAPSAQSAEASWLGIAVRPLEVQSDPPPAPWDGVPQEGNVMAGFETPSPTTEREI